MQIIVDELKKVREKYGDDRRTEIIDESGELSVEDLIAEEDMAITVTSTGYIKRTAISTYRNQRRGGKGRIGMRTRSEERRVGKECRTRGSADRSKKKKGEDE